VNRGAGSNIVGVHSKKINTDEETKPKPKPAWILDHKGDYGALD